MTESKRERDPFAHAYWTCALFVILAAIIGGGRRGR